MFGAVGLRCAGLEPFEEFPANLLRKENLSRLRADRAESTGVLSVVSASHCARRGPRTNSNARRAWPRVGMLSIGVYVHGQGVPRNDNLAYRWFRKAAVQGHILAIHNLGHSYELGHLGVKQSPLGLGMIRKSARRGLCQEPVSMRTDVPGWKQGGER